MHPINKVEFFIFLPKQVKHEKNDGQNAYK